MILGMVHEMEHMESGEKNFALLPEKYLSWVVICIW